MKKPILRYQIPLMFIFCALTGNSCIRGIEEESGYLIALNIYPPNETGIPNQFVEDVPVLIDKKNNFDISLLPAIDFYGFIGLEDATGMIGIDANVLAMIPESIISRTTVSSDGTFSLKLIEGSYLFFFSPLDEEGIPPVQYNGIDVPYDGDYNFTISEIVTVTGYITFDDGEPVSNVTVALTNDEEVQLSTEGTTDDEGYYTIHTTPGSYFLVLKGGKGSNFPHIVSSTKFRIEEGDTYSIDYEVPKFSSVHLSGRLVNYFGEFMPEVDLIVSGTNPETGGTYTVTEKTGADGTFSVYIPNGEYSMVFSPPYNSIYSTIIDESMEKINLNHDSDLGEVVIYPKGILTGTVYSDTDEPMANVSINITEMVGYNYTYSTKTDEEGSFTISVSYCNVKIEAIPPNESLLTRYTEEVDIKNQSTRCEIHLKEGIPLTGVVTYQDVPVGMVTVQAVNTYDGSELSSSITDDNGEYLLIIPR